MTAGMAALDARVETIWADGSRRTLSFDDFYRPPGDTPNIETNLRHGELITAVVLPPPPPGRQIYRKVRDRASYAFALVSVAVVLHVDGGNIGSARVAFGSIAPRPWRSREAEAVLLGKAPQQTVFEAAAQAALKGARGYGNNDFKIPLARRTLVAVLQQVAGGKG
jgi:xanthine dehydrogenase YagS FAD-binding subunit